MSETVSLREYLELKIAHERELRQANEKAMEHRLDGMNKLREQINRERGSFVSREMYDTKNDLLSKRTGDSETKISNIATARSTLNWLWGVAIALAALILSVGQIIATALKGR